MPAEDLEDAARVLQGGIGTRRFCQPAAARAEGGGVVELADSLVARSLARLGVVSPGRRVVLLALGVEPGEEPGEVLGILELLGDQRRGVGVGEHVILEVLLFFEDVADQAAQKNDVGAGAERGVDVGHGRGAREPGIDVHAPWPRQASPA